MRNKTNMSCKPVVVNPRMGHSPSALRRMRANDPLGLSNISVGYKQVDKKVTITRVRVRSYFQDASNLVSQEPSIHV